MSKPILFSPDVAPRMQLLLKQAKTATELRRIQCMYMGANQMSSVVVAPLVGLTPEHIRSIWSRFRREGESFLLQDRRGKVRGKAHLTLQEEKQFLAPFIKKAKKSGILIVSEVHEAHKTRLGKDKLHHSLTYNLLHRHDWRKIAPRPSHPKANKKAQEEFKSSFPPKRKTSKVASKKKKSAL